MIKAMQFRCTDLLSPGFSHIHVRRTISTGSKATILRRQRRIRSSARPVAQPSSGKDIGHSNQFQLGSELLDEDAIIVSIDHGYPRLQRDNMSFGISSLDTRDVQSLPLGYGALNLQKKFNTRYLEVRRDQSEVLDGIFHHGAVELVTQDELLVAIREAFQLDIDNDNDASEPNCSRDVTESKRKIILTGWALGNDVEFLRRRFDLHLTQHAHQMRIVDAQSEYGPPAVGLEVALERMRLPSFECHNSGNDAFYALQCLLTLMCFSGKKLSDLPSAWALHLLQKPVLDFDFSPAFPTPVQTVMKELDLLHLLTWRGQQARMPRADAQQTLRQQSSTDIEHWQISCLSFAQRVWNHISRSRSVSEADAILKTSWDSVDVPSDASSASIKSLPLIRLLFWTTNIAHDLKQTIIELDDADKLRGHVSAAMKLLQTLPSIPKAAAIRPTRASAVGPTSIAELEGYLQPLSESTKARLRPKTMLTLCVCFRERSIALAKASRSSRTDADGIKNASQGYITVLKGLYNMTQTDSSPPLWATASRIGGSVPSSAADPKYLESVCLRVFIYETILKHIWSSFRVPQMFEAISVEAARLAKAKDISESKVLSNVGRSVSTDLDLGDQPVRDFRTVVLDQHQPTVLQATLPTQSQAD